MVGALNISGMILILFGAIGGLLIGQQSGTPLGVATFLTSSISGVFFLGFSTLLQSVLNIEAKLLGKEIKKDDLTLAITGANDYFVRSSILDIYESEKEKYQLFYMKDEVYLGVRALKKYYESEGDEVNFSIPNGTSKKIVISDSYTKDTDLFKVENMVFVKLSALGLKATIKDGSVSIDWY